MNLKQAREQMEQAPMLRVDPFPEPLNPWEHLAQMLGEEDVDESDELFPMIMNTYRQYVLLSRGCPMRTQDRILAYCLARCVEDPPTARILIAELKRCLDVIDPAPAPKRKLKDAAAATAPAEGTVEAAKAS